MNSVILSQVENEYLKTDVPDFSVGDTVEVSTIIREGSKQRIQKFKGLVISRHGSGARATFTVRKISHGIGVEKIFPVNSTNISKIELLKKGKVRRAKIYYMRERVGRLAMKVKDGGMVPVEAEVSEVSEETASE